MNRTLVAGLGALLAAGVSIAAATARPDAEPAVALDGAHLFVTRGCATCHDGPGLVSAIGLAPSLQDIGSTAADRIDDLDAAAYIEQSIREPGVFTAPGWTGSGPLTSMPVIALTDDEVHAIVDYLLTEPPPASDATG